MEASLAVQTWIVGRLRAAEAVIDLVPEANIFDRSSRPERFPCILVGEAEVIDDEVDCSVASDVAVTLHVWATDLSFETVKLISGAARRALRGAAETFAVGGFELSSLFFERAQFVRDPGGAHTHGVLTFTARTQDLGGDGE